MQETELELLQRTSMAMYLGMDALYQLHADVTLDGNDGPELACAHCSQIADAVVVYPCPSVQILMTDFFDVTSETSEPAESAEPSA